MQTKIKGDISEAKALFEFQKRNIPVLLPWGDKERYDMVIELSNHFFRVQVKTANEEKMVALYVILEAVMTIQLIRDIINILIKLIFLCFIISKEI